MNTAEQAAQLFTQQKLDELFPADRADAFFDAMYGAAEDGAYDIRLVFRSARDKSLNFAFELHQRPGKCLACNLTYGLPQVFDRHPIINLKGLAVELGKLAGLTSPACRLGRTEEKSAQLHCIPFSLES